MRLTITRKIALAVISLVIISIGTMAWVTSQNLKTGFIAYLNQLESQDLEALAKLFAEDYRQHGNLDRFSHDRRAMRDLIESMRLQSQLVENNPPPRRPHKRPDIHPENRPRPADGAAEFDNGPADRTDRPDRPNRQNRADRADQADRADRRGPADGPPGNPPPMDPTGFGQRLSVLDQNGHALIGPGDASGGIVQPIVLDGLNVGSLRLAPLRQIADASGSGFVRAQIRQILLLAAVLIALSVLLSLWLARHLLRPVASLRAVTQRIAQGQLEARAEVLSKDELGELAEHVNGMAHSLQQNEAQRRKMLADISHELRTPLTVIRGEIEALLDGVRQSSPAALKSLHEEVLRLNKLINDIQQINLADAGELSYQLQRVDLTALLNTVLERYRPRIEAAKLTLSSELPGTPLMVQADADRLTQVIANLLENSLRYTDAGGHLHCSLARNGPLIELSMEDSAPGVADGTHARSV